MFINPEPKEWGAGIPQYKYSDIMTKDELYDFALEVVVEYESKNGVKFIDANPKKDSYPSLVCKINGELTFILVEASVAPETAKLSNDRKRRLLDHARKFRAKCYYASVGFGACDALRFDAGLALRGDEYFANYAGLEEVLDDPMRHLIDPDIRN